MAVRLIAGHRRDPAMVQDRAVPTAVRILRDRTLAQACTCPRQRWRRTNPRIFLRQVPPRTPPRLCALGRGRTSPIAIRSPERDVEAGIAAAPMGASTMLS
ncbi:hypothetical protein ASF39_19155 [Methylobacterium sp. Leaf108]|nr:hypothetical protein ASF39_19155 [Methylobacterium sp. Leaf108]